MSNSMLPSSKQVSAVLRLSQVNPRVPGPLSVILETGSSQYLENRVIELIRDAQRIAPTNKVQLEGRKELLRAAVTLLAVAQIKLEQEYGSKEPKPPKAKSTPTRHRRPMQESNGSQQIQSSNSSERPQANPPS